MFSVRSSPVIWTENTLRRCALLMKLHSSADFRKEASLPASASSSSRVRSTVTWLLGRICFSVGGVVCTTPLPKLLSAPHRLHGGPSASVAGPPTGGTRTHQFPNGVASVGSVGTSRADFKNNTRTCATNSLPTWHGSLTLTRYVIFRTKRNHSMFVSKALAPPTL